MKGVSCLDGIADKLPDKLSRFNPKNFGIYISQNHFIDLNFHKELFWYLQGWECSGDLVRGLVSLVELVFG